MKNNRLHKALRSYKFSQEQKLFSVHRKLRAEILSARVSSLQSAYSSYIFGPAKPLAELITRQYISKILGQRFDDAIRAHYYAGESISYPLPLPWQKTLQTSNLNVSIVASSLMWAAFVTLTLFRNCISDLRLFQKIFLQTDSSKHSVPYVYFLNLTADNLPRNMPQGTQSSSIGTTFDVCSWFYKHNFYCSESIAQLVHNVASPEYMFRELLVKYSPDPWINLGQLKAKVKLFIWWLGAVALAIFDCFRGRWWHSMLLSEATKAKAIYLCKADELAKAYFFHNGNSAYRPLWTYAAEQRQTKTILYFYSASEQPLKKDEPTNLCYRYPPLSWPSIMVWTEHQKSSLIKSSIADERQLRLVGPIWFTDSGKTLKADLQRSIAVFPIEPHRIISYRDVSTLADWWGDCPNVHRQFLEDIASILEEVGIHMLVKQKREINNLSAKPYQLVKAALQKNRNVTFIDPSIPVFRVMQNTLAAISMPFTSAALCQKYRDYPSVYYDPTSYLSKVDPASNGLEILSGKDELSDWVTSRFTIDT